MAEGNARRRDLAAPFEPTALEALREELREARGLPSAYRDLLLDELALLLDASRRHLAVVAPRGALTRRGFKVAALRAYEERQARVERVLRLLGLLEKKDETKDQDDVDKLIRDAQAEREEER